FGGIISGIGAVTKAGAGTLTVSGNNSYQGGTTISGGVLKAAHNNALGMATGAVTVNSGSLFAASGINVANPVVINPSGTSGGLVAYWNFDNSTLNTVNTSVPGTFNTSGSTEVFNPTTNTLSIASAGANAAAATVNLSDLNGTMGAQWGVFSG